MSTSTTSSALPALARKKFSCDICNIRKAALIQELLTPLQCRKCGVQVHEECYDAGGALEYTHGAVPDSYALKKAMPSSFRMFTCHPCSEGASPWGLDCQLCDYKQNAKGRPNNARLDEPTISRPKAFHRIEKWKWNEDGAGGEEKTREPADRRYCHTLCGYGNRSSGNVWGCDKDKVIDNDPMHHFQQLASKTPFNIPKGLGTEEKSRRKAELAGLKRIIDTKNTYKQQGLKNKTYRCQRCTVYDPKVARGAWRLLTQCQAGDDDEPPYLKQYHTNHEGEEDYEACAYTMHFGCAKYISSNDLKVIFKTKWGGNNEQFRPPRVYFYPGLTDLVKLYTRAREVAASHLSGEPIDENHRHFPFTKMPTPEKIAADNGIMSPWKASWRCFADVADDLPDDEAEEWNDALKIVVAKAVNMPTFGEIVARYCDKHAAQIHNNVKQCAVVGPKWTDPDLVGLVDSEESAEEEEEEFKDDSDEAEFEDDNDVEVKEKKKEDGGAATLIVGRNGEDGAKGDRKERDRGNSGDPVANGEESDSDSSNDPFYDLVETLKAYEKDAEKKGLVASSTVSNVSPSSSSKKRQRDQAPQVEDHQVKKVKAVPQAAALDEDQEV